MSLIKKEDIEYFKSIGREDISDAISQAETMYEAGTKTKQEATEMIQKIYANPTSKRKFEEINKEAGLGLNIPKSPIDAYIEPVQKELDGLKKEKEEERKRKDKEAVHERLKELNIPESKLPEIAAFQAQHGITNNISAINFWAETREPEPVSAEYTRNKDFFFKEPPDENVATQNAVAEIRQYKKSIMGRR